MRTTLVGHFDEVTEHRARDASTPGKLSGVHRLDLKMAVANFSKRPDTDEHTVVATRIELDLLGSQTLCW